ncbi:signal peptidase II [Chloroflexota bacterium]
MRRVSSISGKWRVLLFFLTAMLVVAADQSSKTWIRSYPKGRSIFESGFFRIIHSQNTGAAFGLFQGQSFALTIIAFIGVAVLLFCALLIYRRFPVLDNRLAISALGLVLGGTVGNLVDRLCLGHVTDFIDFRFWPAFNIADSAIVVGTIMFACLLLMLARTEKQGAARAGKV